jgi:hypothetical protein
VVVSALFVANTLVESTRSSLFGLVIQAAGVAFYFWWRSASGRGAPEART